MRSPTTSISIVSHSQGSLVANLLADIERFCACEKLCVVLTLNLPEQLPFTADSFSFSMKIICNTAPQGFAANHNQAFAQITGEYFCVMNPDIRFSSDPFPSLLECLKNPVVGVTAPLVLGETGEIEDSARHFPSPLKLLCKAFDGCKGGDYVVRDEKYLSRLGGRYVHVVPARHIQTVRRIRSEILPLLRGRRFVRQTAVAAVRGGLVSKSSCGSSRSS